MQFVVTDVIYTHSATTTDSHLRVAPSAPILALVAVTAFGAALTRRRRRRRSTR